MPGSAAAPVHAVIGGPAADVVLSRPERRNALSPAALSALTDILAELRATPAVGAAVTGGAINAGAALALARDLLVIGGYIQVKEAEMGITPPVNAAWLSLRYPAAAGLRPAPACRRFTGRTCTGSAPPSMWSMTSG